MNNIVIIDFKFFLHVKNRRDINTAHSTLGIQRRQKNNCVLLMFADGGFD